MTVVTIRMPKGDWLCSGDVHRLEAGTRTKVQEGVEVRHSAPSDPLSLDEPGHYQYEFRIQGGAGELDLEAKDEPGNTVGNDHYDGVIIFGLVLDIRIA